MPYTVRVSTLRFFAFLILLALIVPCFAQTQFGPAGTGEIIIAVVPMIGSGTYDDPRRPQLAPVRQGSEKKADEDDDFDYRYIISDDGKCAIVVFRATHSPKLDKIRGAKASGVTIFERGKGKRADLERELQKYVKDFRIEDLIGEAAASRDAAMKAPESEVEK